MAEHMEDGQDTRSSSAELTSSKADPREHNETSIGRGESGSARDEDSRSEAHASTSSGRSSNESDTRSKAVGEEESEGGLTMGTNGGEKIGGKPLGRAESGSGRESGGEKKRKAS